MESSTSFDKGEVCVYVISNNVDNRDIEISILQDNNVAKYLFIGGKDFKTASKDTNAFYSSDTYTLSSAEPEDYVFLVARSTSNDASFRFKVVGKNTWEIDEDPNASIDEGGSSNLPLIIGLIIAGIALAACIGIIIWKVRQSK